MWSSMLGLPDTILRQSVAEARLGEAETRRATQAFHRASGHGQMTKQVFVQSVVRELLPNFPTPLAERLFGCINIDLSGTLKYKEFISTVCVLKVGTPREQLKLVFRVLDSTESGYITRKDVRTMLSWVMTSEANDELDGGGLPWTAATFESTLFAKAEKLKWDTFRTRMLSSGGQVCQGGLVLVSWVHSLGLAMTFQESSLPTTPVAVVAPSATPAALALSNELTTTPSTLHVLKLYHASCALYGDKKTSLHHHFHRLHANFGHGIGVPKDVIYDAFASTFVFPSAFLDCMGGGSRGHNGEDAPDAPTLRDWMLHLAFAAHESMLEGLRCLFELFVDASSGAASTSPRSSVVSDLSELLYHLVPAPTYVLQSPRTDRTSHIAPPPLPQDIALWTDEIVAAADKDHVTFADFCGWLSGQQPALLHALHECCDMVHLRLLGAKVKPTTAIQVVHGLLQVYDGAANPGVPGQEWYCPGAAIWQPFVRLDDSHTLKAKLRPEDGRDDELWTHLDRVFVNKATCDALCRWHSSMVAPSDPPLPPALALDNVLVRVTNDRRQLEDAPVTINLVTSSIATTEQVAGATDISTTNPIEPTGSVQENHGTCSSGTVIVLSGRTPQEYVPVLVHLATGASPRVPSSGLLYRLQGADKWLPWPSEQPKTAGKTVADLALDTLSIEATWHRDVSPNANSGSSTTPLSPPSDLVDGTTATCAVGLSNLGNSCFMNAVLQCLFHTTPLQEYFVSDEYLYDLNVWNTYGMQGVFAAVYGELARVMSSNRSRPIAPQTFKLAIGKLYPLFQGHLQHDAHECLSVLLQGLSEDLSRPLRAPSVSPSAAAASALKSTIQTAKPYVDLPDSNGRPDEEVAFEWWRAHVLRDPSIITALFTGQFKSALDCSACGQTSNRFEPFSFLQVPLPPSLHRWRTVYVHVGHGQSIQKRKVQLDSTATTADLVAALVAQDNGPPPTSPDLVHVVAILHGHKIHAIVQPRQLLVDVGQDLHVYSYSGLAHPSTSSAPSPSRRWQCVYRRQRLVPFYFLHPFRVQLYGTPFLLPSTARMTGHELYAWVHTHQPPPAPVLPSQDTDKAIYFALPSVTHPTWPFTLRFVRATDGLACSRCPWTSNCVGCPVVPFIASNSSSNSLDDSSNGDESDPVIVLQPHEMLAIDWGVETAAAPPELHPSYVQFHATPPPAHPLEDCVGMLCSEETVDMYCGQCKTSLPHTKRLALWSTPPVLVVQLKRFETLSESQSMVKAETCIRFPPVLSLAPFLATNAASAAAPADGIRSGDDDNQDAAGRGDTLPVPTTFVWKDDIAVTFPYPTATTAPGHPDYDLYGIVCHIGVLGAGHYVAYVREAGKWWFVDDMTVSAVPDLNLSKLMAAAYLLFYQRHDMVDVAMDKWFPRSDLPRGIQVNVEDLKRQVHTWTKPKGTSGTPQHTRTKSKYWLNWTWR